MPTTDPTVKLRRDITVLVGPGSNAANRIDIRTVPVFNIFTFVINGKESDWSVELGQVTDVDDPEQIAMYNYSAITNNKHLKKVGGY